MKRSQLLVMQATFGACALLSLVSCGGAGSSSEPTAAAANPVTPAPVDLGSARLYVSPKSNAKSQADNWRATRPVDADQMDLIAAQPQAAWFGDWNIDVRKDVDAVVTAASNASQLPVLVAYNIPIRDCGGFASGGAATVQAYQQWINSFASGIGDRQALVVLEPDALPSMNCLSATDQAQRLDLLRNAVRVLKARGSVRVYIDAGHSAWQSVSTMASRLQAANVQDADGFALNVANSRSNSEIVSYGNRLSADLGGKRYIIDTGRNGQGAPDLEWCNPPSRGLGTAPSTKTGSAQIDAVLWIKPPGDSDGPCNGGPTAGIWYPEYALGLAKRANLTNPIK